MMWLSYALMWASASAAISAGILVTGKWQLLWFLIIPLCVDFKHEEKDKPKATDDKNNVTTEVMIVQQTSIYATVGEELESVINKLNELGCEIKSITETKVDKVPDLTDQAFIVVYNTASD